MPSYKSTKIISKKKQATISYCICTMPKNKFLEQYYVKNLLIKYCKIELYFFQNLSKASILNKTITN